MIEFFTHVGNIINVTIGLIAIFIYCSMRITWSCGICGKINNTGLLRFLFCMCNHMGDT
jgi:hypothetical protein